MFHHQKHLLGMGTVGEKGQIVIPAEAREKYDISTGDKLVFFGHGPMLHLIKSEKLEGFLDKMADKFSKFDKMREDLREDIKNG
jgi:AbrB family looped-hinge helix DNA binding protein